MAWKARCSMRGTRETSPLNAELFVMITRWRHSIGWLVQVSCAAGRGAPRIILEIMDLDSKDMRHFIEGMPKVELHAHLSGSISMQTIQRLLELKKRRGDITAVDPEDVRIATKQIRTLDDCFAIFKLIQKLCDNEEAIQMVTREVIHEFAADNVKYLELRSTPRAVPNGMTKTAYVDAILRAIGECHSEQDLDITVRLLLSIDRRCPVSDAVDTVNMAAEYMRRTGGIVTGIDLSGDPMKGDINLLLPVLSSAKEKGLKLTLHMAEVPDQWEECNKLLALSPDRIGHGTYLHLAGNDQNGLVETITAGRIPLELCLTSNVKDQTVPCLADHHFAYWYEKGHPCVICTDDKGVFATSLSEEYALVADSFHLSPQQIWTLSFSAIDYIFADDQIKERLRKKWADLKSTLLKSDCEPV